MTDPTALARWTRLLAINARPHDRKRSGVHVWASLVLRRILIPCGALKLDRFQQEDIADGSWPKREPNPTRPARLHPRFRTIREPEFRPKTGHNSLKPHSSRRLSDCPSIPHCHRRPNDLSFSEHSSLRPGSVPRSMSRALAAVTPLVDGNLNALCGGRHK